MAERMFPIMDGPAIPWRLIAPHERQAQRTHSQTLERLAERGGLSPCEAMAVLEDREWCRMVPTEARAQLAALLEADAAGPLREALGLLLLDDGQDELEDPCGHAERAATGYARINVSVLRKAREAAQAFDERSKT